MGDLEMEKGLLKRFRDLEASQEKLREQLGFVLREGIVRERGGSGSGNGNENTGEKLARRRDDNDFDVVIIPGHFAKNPYHSALQHIGHAVYVCRPVTGEIIYWNHSAESLYGWSEYETLGQRVANLLIDDENYPAYEKVMERLNNGQTWSGQFPFKKRSGQMFMAMITKSPLYENNELIGVITVSSDSAILNDMNKEKSNAYWNGAHDQQKQSKFNFGRLRPQPDVASSVSNLAGILFSKLHIRGNAQDFQVSEKGVQTNSTKIVKPDVSPPNSPDNCMACNENKNHMSFSRDSKQGRKTKGYCTSDFSNTPKEVVEEELKRSSIKSKPRSESGLSKVLKNYNISHEQSGEYGAKHGLGNSLEGLSTHGQMLEERVEDCPSIPAHSAETNCSSNTGSSKDDVSLATECDIHWEDLLVGEEVGQGSYAVVYRGIWNGSDVAIKVLTETTTKRGLY